MVTGKAGKSGYGSASTAEDVTNSIDAKHLTAIITGSSFLFHLISFTNRERNNKTNPLWPWRKLSYVSRDVIDFSIPPKG